jgi:hypothetical protein
MRRHPEKQGIWLTNREFSKTACSGDFSVEITAQVQKPAAEFLVNRNRELACGVHPFGETQNKEQQGCLEAEQGFP